MRTDPRSTGPPRLALDERGDGLHVERFQIEAGHHVFPQIVECVGHLFAGADGHEQERTAADPEVQEQSGRGVVERVGVVDEDDRRRIVVAGDERVGGHTQRAVVAGVGEAGRRQEGCEGTQRDARRGPRCGDADDAAGCIGQARLRESGLADPGRPGQHDTLRGGIAQQGTDVVLLVFPSDERPAWHRLIVARRAHATTGGARRDISMGLGQ